jgi:septal ring factor EnvC (AmiA/AmiB activator)
MIVRKASLQQQAAQGVEITAQRLQQLSSQAGDLRELIESIEAEKRQRAEEQKRLDLELLARAATRPPHRVALAPAPPAAPRSDVEEPAAEVGGSSPNVPAVAAASDPAPPKN